MAEVGFDQLKKNREVSFKEMLLFSPLDEINKDETGQIRFVEGLNGPIAFLSSKGINYKPFNEDIQYLNNWSNFFASIDGMGGMGKEGSGRKAAFILAEEMKKGTNESQNIKKIHLKAHYQMRANHLGEGGVCYLTAQIKNNTLETNQAGDVRAVIIKKNGQIFETQDECLPNKKNTVYNYIQGNSLGKITSHKFPLEVGDRLVIASDGVWDNFYSSKNSLQEESTKNLASLIKDKSIREAINLLNHYLKNRMSSGKGKPDNYNLIIYDFVKPTRGNLNLNNAQNIRELLLSFDHLKGIQGSSQYYSPEQLKSIVKRFFNGELTKNHLTRSGDLREKVLQLSAKR